MPHTTLLDHQTWELVGIDGRLGGFVIEAGCLHLSPLGCRIVEQGKIKSKW